MSGPATKTLDHGGVHLHVRTWPTQAPPEAQRLLVVNHGLGEHGGRYAGLADFFTAGGYAVVAFDHQGHGESSGPRGVIASDESLIDELHAVVADAQARLSISPARTAVWGHSMGALLTLLALEGGAVQNSVRAAVATAAPLELGFAPPPVLRALASPVAALLPNVTRPNGLDRDALSRDPEVVSRYEADPLVHDRVSMRLGHLLLARPRDLLAGVRESRTPVLVMHGSADRIGTLAGAERYATLNRDSGVELRSWPGLYHELHNEPERLEVLAFAKTWLDNTLPIV